MKTISQNSGWVIRSDFGTSVSEGTIAASSQGAGKMITFEIEQLNPTLKSGYVNISPISGSTGDFWDAFFSNQIGGEPADDFALGKFVSLNPSGLVSFQLNADSFVEPTESFSIAVYLSVVDEALGRSPVIQGKFEITDDDGLIISGAASEGAILTAKSTLVDPDGMGALSYQWLRGGVAVSGATAATYTLGQSDVGATMSVRVSYTDGQGTAEVKTSAATAMVKDTITSGNDVVVMTSGGKVVTKGGNDVVTGSAAADTIITGAGADKVNGRKGNDQINGGGGNDSLSGAAGDDVLKGGGGNDLLNGDGGNDRLIGGGGKDVLNGGKGMDMLKGGGGADVFEFNTIKDSLLKSADTIQDFKANQNDVIDLSGIDAMIGMGNQAFTFIGDDDFSGHKGELRYQVTGKSLTIFGDIDGDANADFGIDVLKVTSLSAGDFIL